MKLQKLFFGFVLAIFLVSINNVAIAQKKENNKEAKTEVNETKALPGEPVPGAEITLEQEPDQKVEGSGSKTEKNPEHKPIKKENNKQPQEVSKTSSELKKKPNKAESKKKKPVIMDDERPQMEERER